MKQTKSIRIALFISMVVIGCGVLAWMCISVYSPFFSSRIFVMFEDSRGNPERLLVETSVQALVPGVYRHIYTLGIFSNDPRRQYADGMVFNSSSKEPIPHGFIRDVQTINNPNTQNERYILAVAAGGREFSLDLRDMAGDFLINNSLDRFTYINLGTTTLQVNNIPYAAAFAMNRTASVRYPFFQSEITSPAQARGIVAFAADADDTLYYIDVTRVSGVPRGGYESHAWVLRKRGRVLEKAIGEENILLRSATVENLIFDVPHFNQARIQLRGVGESSFQGIEYSVRTGDVIDTSGERRIQGMSMRYE